MEQQIVSSFALSLFFFPFFPSFILKFFYLSKWLRFSPCASLDYRQQYLVWQVPPPYPLLKQDKGTRVQSGWAVFTTRPHSGHHCEPVLLHGVKVHHRPLGIVTKIKTHIYSFWLRNHLCLFLALATLVIWLLPQREKKVEVIWEGKKKKLLSQCSLSLVRTA